MSVWESAGPVLMRLVTSQDVRIIAVHDHLTGVLLLLGSHLRETAETKRPLSAAEVLASVEQSESGGEMGGDFPPRRDTSSEWAWFVDARVDGLETGGPVCVKVWDAHSRHHTEGPRLVVRCTVTDTEPLARVLREGLGWRLRALRESGSQDGPEAVVCTAALARWQRPTVSVRLPPGARDATERQQDLMEAVLIRYDDIRERGQEGPEAGRVCDLIPDGPLKSEDAADVEAITGAPVRGRPRKHAEGFDPPEAVHARIALNRWAALWR